MENDDTARRGAKSILEHCLGLSAGSHFVLLLDESSLEVLDPLFLAAQDLDIQLTTLFFSKLQQMTLRDLGNTAKRIISDEDAALLAHTDAAECARFRTKLVSQWRGTTRLGTMPGASRFILETAADMNVRFIIDQCFKLTPPLLNGRNCTITTFNRSGGEYQLRFQLGGIRRIPVQSTGILGPHAWGNVPSGEIFTAPIESSADGEYLVNGAIDTLAMNGDEAILTFRGGRLVQHQLCSTSAPIPYLEQICKLSKSRKDRNWNVIAEFGIGVNQGIRDATGIPLLDEKILGSVHIAIGNNIGWQGENNAQIHLDMISKGPTVMIDGKAIIERGKHVAIPEEFDDLAAYQPHPSYSWPEEARIASIFRDRAHRDEHGELLIELTTTQSGRVTEVPIANEQTRYLVGQVLRWPSERPLRLESFDTITGKPLSPQLLYKLLSMLWAYGLIQPDRI